MLLNNVYDTRFQLHLKFSNSKEAKKVQLKNGCQVNFIITFVPDSSLALLVLSGSYSSSGKKNNEELITEWQRWCDLIAHYFYENRI